MSQVKVCCKCHRRVTENYRIKMGSPIQYFHEECYKLHLEMSHEVEPSKYPARPPLVDGGGYRAEF